MGLSKNIKLQKAIVFAIVCIPLIGIVASLFINPSADPYERLANFTGEWCLRLLIITLAITPLKVITNIKRFGAFRRTFGVATFVYAFAHVLSYMIFESEFDIFFLFEDIQDRRFIAAGAIAFVMMIPLALTSNNFFVGKLGGAKWKKLHRLVFPLSLIAGLHFLLQQRGEDLGKPLFHLGIIIALIIFRIIVSLKKKRKAATA